MPLVAMGELLRAGRQKRGLSVEEIAAQLKISPRLIRDLEMGNEPALPHAVYVRGFIKSYAKLLDINPDDLAPGLAVYEREEEVALPPPPRSGGGLLVLAVLCALAFAGYWYYNTYFMPARQAQSSEIPATRSEPVRPALESAPQPAPGPPAAPVSQPAPPSPASQAPVPVAAPVIAAQPSPAAGEGTDLPDVMETAGEEAQVLLSSFRAPEREMPVTGSGRGITVNLGVPGGGALPVNQLVLTGMAECWVHATADETDTREFSIRPDETFSLSFSKTLVIKLGNAGGVRLKYNGVNLPAPGKDGQVMTLSFPEAGSG
ncbi:MAG: DUF4115 domain-containing protein [Deltaproteobacteria bacterium]|nr:DUF4115 domain-containing protein [Deltaproteobacteria bacterium]